MPDMICLFIAEVVFGRCGGGGFWVRGGVYTWSIEGRRLAGLDGLGLAASERLGL